MRWLKWCKESKTHTSFIYSYDLGDRVIWVWFPASANDLTRCAIYLTFYLNVTLGLFSGMMGPGLEASYLRPSDAEVKTPLLFSTVCPEGIVLDYAQGEIYLFPWLQWIKYYWNTRAAWLVLWELRQIILFRRYLHQPTACIRPFWEAYGRWAYEEVLSSLKPEISLPCLQESVPEPF